MGLKWKIISIIRALPLPLRDVVYKCAQPFVNKQKAELAFWKSRWELNNHHFANDGYQKLMLAIAQEKNDSFIEEKIVADFGCGPRGSLKWASRARMRIGIDVLVDRYFDCFAPDLLSHDMVYLKCTERHIPLPTHSVDLLYTVNALDHVDHLPEMCSELTRVLKPGGELLGSFNLNEPRAPTEPQMLTEDRIQEHLLKNYSILSYRVSAPGDKDDLYGPFYTGSLREPGPGDRAFLWLRAKKK